MSDAIKVGDQFKLPVRIGDRGAIIQHDGEKIDYSKLDLMVACIAINNHDRLQQENLEFRDCIAKNEQFVTWLIENLPKDVLDDISSELSEVTMRNMKTLNKND